jgi:hypothetical protein
MAADTTRSQPHTAAPRPNGSLSEVFRLLRQRGREILGEVERTTNQATAPDEPAVATPATDSTLE